MCHQKPMLLSTHANYRNDLSNITLDNMIVQLNTQLLKYIKMDQVSGNLIQILS